MRKIKSKTYYRIEFALASPLMIGSKQQERTDKDLLVDACGHPVIPGSALAGIYRSGVSLSQEEDKKYFGYVPGYEEWKADKEKTVENISSRIIVYDACLKEGENPFITRRDFVALDEYKTAKPGSKFDAEVLEPGVAFVTYIEQNCYGDERDVAGDIVKLWQENQIAIGAKTMRGFGAVKDVKAERAEFDISNPDGVEKWLKFDMFAHEGWEEWNHESTERKGRRCSVKLKLKLQGAISIRRYTTSIAEGAEKKMPDQEQLTVYDHEKPYAVIPGSTWAGAFRSHMKKLSPGLNMDYFGFAREKEKKKRKSKIRFSESKIDGGTDKIVSRNAIDRFTGGTVDKALFTEKVHYGGTTVLEIGFDDTMGEEMLLSLAAAITDLHYGFLSVGGETSIGHGLFEIMEIDGESMAELKMEQGGQKLYKKIAEILKGKMEG